MQNPNQIKPKPSQIQPKSTQIQTKSSRIKPDPIKIIVNESQKPNSRNQAEIKPSLEKPAKKPSHKPVKPSHASQGALGADRWVPEGAPS